VLDDGPEMALQRHVGLSCGAPPEVEIIRLGEGGVFAARGTMRVSVPAYDLFKRLTDPEENKRIFASNTASVNFRNLLEEDREKGTRLFEVSKTGRWRLIGIPLTFESTVFAEEDWRGLEIRFRLKKPGAMKHFSGFWRLVPVNRNETLVIFYNEGMPNFPFPVLFGRFVEKVVREMCASLLEDLRAASSSFAEVPAPAAPSTQAHWEQRFKAPGKARGTTPKKLEAM